MGNKASSSATSNQTINNTTVNETAINSLNKQINNYSSETIINSASTCSSGINQLQSVKFADMNIVGDFNVGEINQKQTAAVTFKCVNQSEVHSEIANGIAQTLQQDIKNNYSTEAQSEMSANLAAKAAAGFGSTANTSANTNSNLTTNNNTTNTTKVNIENIIENAVSNHFTQNTVQECINMAENNQSVDFQNINVGGSVNVKAVNQEQALTVLAECKQLTSGISSLINSVKTELGLVTVAEAATATKASAKAEGTSSAESTGIFQDLGSMVSGIIGSIFGSTGMIVIAVIIGILFLVFFVFK